LALNCDDNDPLQSFNHVHNIGWVWEGRGREGKLKKAHKMENIPTILSKIVGEINCNIKTHSPIKRNSDQ